MDLLGYRKLISILTIVELAFIVSVITSPDSRKLRPCCHSEKLSGLLTLSSRLGEKILDSRDTTLEPIKFSVDHSKGLLYGEHRTRYPVPRYVQFVADIRDDVQSIFIREKFSRRCWKIPTGVRTRRPCTGDEAAYKGSFRYGSEGSKDRTRAHVYDRGSGSKHEPLSSWLNFRSLLMLDEDTCLPILDVNAENLDHYISFHRMKRGLESLKDFWNYESGSWVDDNCKNLEEHSDSNEDDETDTDSKSHRERSRDTEEKKKRRRRGVQKYRNEDQDRELDKDMNSIIQLDIYLYLLRHFYPRVQPEPCCGPNIWQASITKTITYAYPQSNYVGQSTTVMPNVYVDHTNGRLAVDIIEYVNGSPTSNLSLLALFGLTTTNTELNVYAVDWKTSPAQCTYFQVTDVHGPMRNNCMPANATFEHTVRLGAGLFNSITLDVFNISGSSTLSDGSMEYSAESYITPKCMPMMELYSWTTPNTKVTGTLLTSNFRSYIVDLRRAFAVPPPCTSVSPIQLTSAQVGDGIKYILSFAGGLG